ncbi:phage antirepressor protein [Firmicutes bacterium CAG:466]|nr:phage antirepressor protein [Firmicutes bacterium CAG:466]
MNEIMNINGMECYEQDGTAYLKLETVARGLGFTTTQNVGGTEYINVRWKRVEEYLEEIGFATSGKRPDFIPENIFYRLAMKAKNETAERFQALVADEIIPSIRKTGGYHVSERPEQIKLEAQKARAEAMLLNAKNRTFQTIMSAVQDKNLSPIAIQVFGLKGLESVFGVDVGNYLPQIEKTYTATEIGEMFGISANKVGSLANKNGMKTEEYGIVVMDKSKYSKKEVSSFRYNEKAVERFREILQV